MSSRSAKECHKNLIFPGDSILFAMATQKECLKIVKILNTYEEASDQQINFDKFKASFSKKVIDSQR